MWGLQGSSKAGVAWGQAEPNSTLHWGTQAGTILGASGTARGLLGPPRVTLQDVPGAEATELGCSRPSWTV